MHPRRPATPESGLATATLVWKRARLRLGLLAAASATVAVAVATVILVQAALGAAVAAASADPPAGVPADEFAAGLAQGERALAASAPALWLLVALLGGTAVAQIARLLTAAREHETLTLRARGASRSQAWGLDGAESLAVGVVGALLGIPLGALVAPLTGATPLTALASWPIGIGTATALALILLLALRRAARASATARGARLTTGALVIVVLAAAALVIWQLPAARPGGADPVVAFAPAVVLAAAAVLALAVVGAAAPVAALIAGRARGVVPALPARQIARRIGTSAVAVLLVSLVAAQVAFAASYTATWRGAATASAALRSGSDLRVDLAPQPARPRDLTAAAGVPGIDAAVPALVAQTEIGTIAAELVAPTTSPDAGPASVDEATASATPVPLGDGATGIGVAATLSDPSTADGSAPIFPSVTLSALLLDGVGTPISVTLDGAVAIVPDGTLTVTATAPLPEGDGPWSLLAIAAAAPTNYLGRTVDIALTDVTAVGATALAVDGSTTIGGAHPDAALAWSAVDDPDAGALPVAATVSTVLAQRLGLSVGDVFEFRYEGTGRRGAVVIAALVDDVPGAAGPLAFTTGLDSLLASQLQRDPTITPANSVWATGDPAAAPQLSAALGDRPVLTATPSTAAAVVGAMVPAWQIATAGAVLLALLAALAIVRTLAGARRAELGVLRALGLTAGTQARMRAAELSALFAAALVLGAGVGLLTAALVVPNLVRATTPGVLASATTWAIDGVAMLTTLGVLAAGLAAVVVLSAFAVGRSSRAALVGEESR
ncbi:FtsX-like permease family protein [Microbacterium telephonicum]|uniref:FtsX-like permease family protein n=1 Tax=Microbacterium telephonicum TaxID=1714841 RepID=A0A498BZU5_9MICO|nr:FtsX-like permease family protein [Microbacterium telephonicum]RLK49005.1 FtsX-like permease family protein [Microbacterium telephonicum]